mgnify:CR=1 FL=1
MPRKKVPCPKCGRLKSQEAELCRACKPSYERTPESRAKMSAALKGKPKPTGWKHSEETKIKMRKHWTAERKEQKRQEVLARNPLARYHGLSCRAAKRLREAAGHCELCGSTRRLDIHHRDRNKRNQALSNLQVLCHRCHMQEHAKTKETGWDSYHRKRH